MAEEAAGAGMMEALMPELADPELLIFSPLILLGFALFAHNVQRTSETNITNIVNDSIISSLQQATTNIKSDQKVSFTCDPSVVASVTRSQENCIQDLAPSISSGKYTAAQVAEVCRPALCVGNNLTISNSIFARILVEMDADTQQLINNNLTNALNAYSNQDNSGIISGGNTVTTTINSITNAVQKQMASFTQEQVNTIEQNQNVILGNVSFSQLSQSSVEKFVSNALQTNSDVQSGINKLRDQISASTIQENRSSLVRTLTYIAIAIVILLIIAGIAWFVRRRRRRSN